MPEWVVGILCVVAFAGFVFVIKNKDELIKKFKK